MLEEFLRTNFNWKLGNKNQRKGKRKDELSWKTEKWQRERKETRASRGISEREREREASDVFLQFCSEDGEKLMEVALKKDKKARVGDEDGERDAFVIKKKKIKFLLVRFWL